MANYVLIAEAVQYVDYTSDHIAWLIRHQNVAGKKVGGVWMVDLDDLLGYVRRVEELGTKKHTPKSKLDRSSQER